MRPRIDANEDKVRPFGWLNSMKLEGHVGPCLASKVKYSKDLELLAIEVLRVL